MIDEIRMQMLIERISAAQEASEQAYSKFNEILSLVNDFSTTVDGYPAKSVDLSLENNRKLDVILDSLSNIRANMGDTKSNKQSTMFFLHYIFICTRNYPISLM